jgi:hypothetical protein
MGNEAEMTKGADIQIRLQALDRALSYIAILANTPDAEIGFDRLLYASEEICQFLMGE